MLFLIEDFYPSLGENFQSLSDDHSRSLTVCQNIPRFILYVRELITINEENLWPFYEYGDIYPYRNQIRLIFLRKFLRKKSRVFSQDILNSS